MPSSMKKYNPGFLTDEELIESFCVRTSDLDSLIETLRETGEDSSSAHSIVIGPRGSGKTHLLRTVAARIRRDPSFAGLFPIVFAEETYEVATCGEFWLECLGHLTEQAPPDERKNLRLTYNALHSTTEDRELEERCLGAILDFSDRHGARLVLIAENLNTLFSEIADPDTGWRMRKTLQTEPRILLLGSATSRFDEIDRPDHALYDLFRTITLHPLNTEECQTLWSAVSGRTMSSQSVRPIEILTGGNPRLIGVIAQFGATQSFHDLMNNLYSLVDDHTDYFKSHLDALPPQERRVYLALARLWRPATSREVAERARVDTNKCSAHLKRLIERGAVTMVGGTSRRRQYYLTERLYNIYYLLRRPSEESQVVRALVQFMSCYYSPHELLKFTFSIADDSNVSDERLRGLQRLAFGYLIQLPQVADPISHALFDRMFELMTMGHIEDALEDCDSLIDLSKARRDTSFETTETTFLLVKSSLLLSLERIDDALAICDEIISTYRRDSQPIDSIMTSFALIGKSLILDDPGIASESLKLVEDMVHRLDSDTHASVAPLIQLVKALSYLSLDQYDDGLQAIDEMPIWDNNFAEDLGLYWTGYISLIKWELQNLREIPINESEVSRLLRQIGSASNAPPPAVSALIWFCANTEPSHALKIISSSAAGDVLLPLTTALRLELGLDTRVSREVMEIADDIRNDFTDRNIDNPKRYLPLPGTD